MQIRISAPVLDDPDGLTPIQFPLSQVLVYGSIAPFVPLFAISTAKPLHVDSVGFAAAAILDIDATSLLFSLWTKLTSIWLLVPFLILLLTHRFSWRRAAAAL